MLKYQHAPSCTGEPPWLPSYEGSEAQYNMSVAEAAEAGTEAGALPPGMLPSPGALPPPPPSLMVPPSEASAPPAPDPHLAALLGQLNLQLGGGCTPS